MLHVTLKNTEGKTVRLGNSLTWGYSVKKDGVHFFWKGDDVTSSLKKNGANNPNLVLKPGDKIYFVADGVYSKYGVDTPPKDPFRRVFWEEGLPSKRELFHIVTEKEEVKEFWRQCCRDYNDNIEEIQRRVPGSSWYEYDDVVDYDADGHIVFCAQVNRDWYHQWWRLTAVYCVRGAYTMENARAVVKKLQSSFPN